MENRYINGIKVYAPRSANELIDFAFSKTGILIAVNAEKLANSNSDTRRITNNNIGYPDGIGAVFALKRKGLNYSSKIAGCELWLEIIDRYHDSKSFFLVGGEENIIKMTVKKLKSDYPNINIVGYRDGFLHNKNDKNNLIKDICKSKPDVVFIAMGSPIQELLMEELMKSHEALYQGLGGSFDIHVGKLSRAPAWFIKNNLEWFFRLLQEPKRLKRQLPLIKFLFLVWRGRF